MKAAAFGMLMILLTTGVWFSDQQMSRIRGGHWEVSPQFSYFSMMLRGDRGHLGILDEPFTPKQSGKYTWFFWNNPQTLPGKPFQVNGLHWKSGKSYLLYEGAIGGPNRNSPNPFRAVRAVTTLTLPTKGLWKLFAVVDGKNIGSIIIEVK
jgi:hypothetical protein